MVTRSGFRGRLSGAAILETVSDKGRGPERFLAALVPVLLGVASGIAGNGLYNDFGYLAAGAVAAVAGVLAAGLWLRRLLGRLPAQAPLHRCISGGLLVCGLAAAVAAAFGSRHLSPYATLAATGLTVTALLITPGVPIANTLFRLALVGFGVALLGGAIVEWRLGHNGLAIAMSTFLELGVIALVYIGARYGAATIVTEAEAGAYRDLGPPLLALGVVFSVAAIAILSQGPLVEVGIPGPAGLAAFGLGVALRKGGRYRVGAAVLGCGVTSVATGVTVASMADGLLAGVTIVGVGLALIGLGARRLDVARWLRAWGRYLTGQQPRGSRHPAGELGRTDMI
jgi:hypothetical protein